MSLKLNTIAQLYGFMYEHNKQRTTLIVIFSGIQYLSNVKSRTAFPKYVTSVAFNSTFRLFC